MDFLTAGRLDAGFLETALPEAAFPETTLPETAFPEADFLEAACFEAMFATPQVGDGVIPASQRKVAALVPKYGVSSGAVD